MKSYLHTLSAVLFYTFGILFIGAYICHVQQCIQAWPLWFFESFDLPFAMSAMLYGGTSFHRSIANPNKKNIVSGVLIAIVLLTVFTYLVVLNYWHVLGLPTQ